MSDARDRVLADQIMAEKKKLLGRAFDDPYWVSLIKAEAAWRKRESVSADMGMVNTGQTAGDTPPFRQRMEQRAADLLNRAFSKD